MLLHALPVILIALTLFYYWFAVANRYIIFLYYHDMGPRFPDTSPFSAVTRSRYWMAGLVVGGAVMVLYTAANWLLGRFVVKYRSTAPNFFARSIPLRIATLLIVAAIALRITHIRKMRVLFERS